MRTVAERKTRQPGQSPVDWRAIRLALGLRQRELAQLLYVSPPFVSQLESGTAKPSKQTLAILRSWLLTPEYRKRLADAGMAYPFPDDLVATVTGDKPASSL